MKIERIPMNYVLVEVRSEFHDEIELGSGQTLYIDPSFEPEKHSMAYGKVIHTPDRLIFDENPKVEHSMDFDAEMEVRPGDMVCFHYLEPGKVKERGVFEVNGKRCIMVRYDKIFLAKRAGEIIMANGYILVEPVPETEKLSRLLVIPEYAKNKEKPNEGIIKHIGKGVKAYRFNKESAGDTNVLKAGDHIIFNDIDKVPLEYSLHNTMGEKLYRMQEKDVMGVYDRN